MNILPSQLPPPPAPGTPGPPGSTPGSAPGNAPGSATGNTSENIFGALASQAGCDPVQLVVFSDDWGRHPSSCQHLVRCLPSSVEVLWVNTLGTRWPRLSVSDFKKVVRRVGQWLKPVPHVERVPGGIGTSGGSGGGAGASVRVICPWMYPGFSRPWQRRLNHRLLVRQIQQAWGSRPQEEEKGSMKRIAVTTIPIVADLVGSLDVDRWIYYCVDDFSVWPGLDCQVMQAMESQLVERVDRVIAASENLAQRLEATQLLTHGIDLSHWQNKTATAPVSVLGSRDTGKGGKQKDSASVSQAKRFVFWGLIDQRLDVSWCRELARRGNLILVGPTQSPDPALLALAGVQWVGPVGYDALPAIAQEADVLVMPYADLPVTRAMQPLKFKEYLATGKPVVGRCLPGIMDWSDAADLVFSAEACARVACLRAETGVPLAQQQARQRLLGETWIHKSEQWLAMLTAA